ncbi:MAG: sigma-70 family RNA polymerase sigma factor [Pedobacter sp.]|nr:sigma-70 family RNA polymerase sigma factor [Pedobacter sp.]
MAEQEFLNMIAIHQGIIYKVCRLYRERKEDRDDLFQEITYQLWKSYPTFKGTAKLSTWMYRIALNTAIASFRKKRPPLEYPQILPDLIEEGPDEALASRQDQLFTALKKLDDHEKALIALYFEEISYKEIAELIGVTENNVGVKLNRIKSKIQKLINR